MKQTRIALLVGVSNYEYANTLKNPINDVDAMNSVLSKLGFEVIALKDTTFKEFKLALNDFGRRLDEFDIGLFYFAGHGIQVKGLNYLIPKDANPLNENQVEFDCINVNQILSLMSDASNETNFIILDACRNNPFERSWHRSPISQGLSYMSAPYSTLIAYSTAPDKTASDGEGNNGLYTSVLITEITSPYLSILQVLQNVRTKMINLSQGEQVPWESTSLLKDFVFNDNIYTSVSTFCQSILYNEDRDVVLNNLNLDSWDLNKISSLNLPIREEDSEAGVIEVYFKDNVLYYDIFDNLEIQLYVNGERDYNLYTTTKNAEKVYAFSKELFDKLGGGLYDNERHQTFRDFVKIKNIALGKAKTSNDNCFTVWIFNNVSFVLKYLVRPKRQFLFQINIKPKKKVIENTLFELLQNDYVSLQNSGVKMETTEESKYKFEDFLVTLPILEFGLFDTAIIRVFNSKNNRNPELSIFLSHSKPRANAFNFHTSKM